jgi:hypothetical protein
VYLRDVIGGMPDALVGEREARLFIKGPMENSTKATLILRKQDKSMFLNVQGNPISFLRGENQFGVVNLRTLIEKFYEAIEKMLAVRVKGFKWPAKVVEAIETGNVKLHSLAIAAYSQEIQFKNEEHRVTLLKLIRSLYSGGYRSWDESRLKDDVVVSDELDLECSYEGLVSLRFVKWQKSKGYRTRMYSLLLYGKKEEMVSKGKTPHKEIERRLRIDLTLTAKWLQNHHCSTLAEVEKRAHKEGGWKQFTDNILNRALEDVKLRYILTFPNPFAVLKEISKKDQAELQGWLDGGMVKKELARSLLDVHGLDTKLSFRFHLAALASRSSLVTNSDKVLVPLLRGDDGALAMHSAVTSKALLSFQDSVWVQRLQGVLPKLLPDQRFPAL